MAKDDMIKFRCQSHLKDRLKRLADETRHSFSDMCRIMLEDYITAQEKALNLPPLPPPGWKPGGRASELNDRPTPTTSKKRK